MNYLTKYTLEIANYLRYRKLPKGGFKGQLVTFLLLICSSFMLSAQDFPPTPGKLVNDYTNTMSSSEIQALEQKLVAFSDSTSIQIAVVLIQSTDGYDIADYGVRMAQKWGIGDKRYNNGILLLAALGDRAVTIQTGYGVEGAVPDAIAYRIIENDIKPAFRANAYYQGLDQATNSLISFTKGEYKADPKGASGTKSGGKGFIILIVIFIIIALISRGGGGKNKGGRVINGKGSSDLFWWMLLNGLGGGGRSDNDSGGFGGGFGGGSGGGGFGGFGGGGFGGGGASGRW